VSDGGIYSGGLGFLLPSASYSYTKPSRDSRAKVWILFASMPAILLRVLSLSGPKLSQLSLGEASRIEDRDLKDRWVDG
jgi:hypothetical protein